MLYLKYFVALALLHLKDRVLTLKHCSTSKTFILKSGIFNLRFWIHEMLLKFGFKSKNDFLQNPWNSIFLFKVQVKTTTCYSHQSDIYCICGIVIRSGRDIFMIYMCPDTPTKIDQFIRCHDGSLTANSRGGSDYEVASDMIL